MEISGEDMIGITVGLAEECPTKLKRMGIKDVFGQLGTPNKLLEYYGLTSKDIVEAVKSI